MSEVSLKVPVDAMVLINIKKKRDCKAPAGGSKRDNLNEPVAANAELDSGDNNERSGTKFVQP